MSVKKLWSIIFVLTISLPIGGSNYSWLSFLQNSYGVNILDLLMIIILFLILIEQRPSFTITRKRFINIIPIVIYTILLVLKLFNSYNTFGLGAIRDVFNYFMCLTYLYSSLLFVKKYFSLNEILKLTRLGFIGYTLITIITAIIQGGNVGRISGNCFSLAIILVPMEMYFYFNRLELNKKWLIYVLSAFVVNTILSQDRTVIVLTVVACLLIMFIESKENLTKTKFYKIIGIMGLLSIVFVLMIINNSEVILRIFANNEASTLTARINTFTYYFDLFQKNLSGYGFGYYMRFFTAGNYMLKMDTYQVDNAFIVTAIKGGLIFAVLYLWIALKPCFVMICKSKKMNNEFRICYCLLLVSAYLMTSQIIQGAATSIFIWTIVGLTINDKKSIEG